MLKDVPGQHPEITFYPKPEGIRNTRFPYRTTEEAIVAGLHCDMLDFLQKGPGVEYAVREVFQQNSENGTRLDVLEIGNHGPFKSLSFQGKILDGYKFTSGHDDVERPAPKIRSSIIADKDYMRLVLSNDNRGTGANYESYMNNEKMMIDYVISPALGITQSLSKDEYKQVASLAYEAKKESSDIMVRSTLGGSPVDELRKAYKEGERYDLIFPELAESADRMNYLQILQASLKPGGYAFVPITWWKPDMMSINGTTHSFTTQRTLLDDTVAVDSQKVPFQEYLANTFPDAYHVIFDGRVKMLVIRGTTPPVQLPEFDAKPQSSHISMASFIWTPKISRNSWKTY